MHLQKLMIFLLGMFLISGMISCNNNGVIPEDLPGKKKYASKLKSEINKLKKDLKTVTEQIKELEPEMEVTKVPVTTQVIGKNTFSKNIQLQGNVEAKESAMIASETGGRIVYLKLEEGGYVKRGQIVGKVDMETVENSIEEVKTGLELANNVYDRQKRLWDKKIGSEIQFLQAKNNKERLEKSLVTLTSQLKKQNIVSPISGYVLNKFQDAGELAGPGTPIAQVISSGNVKVVTAVPDNMVASVKRGQQVNVFFPAIDKTIKAKVSKVGKVINPANRTFDIEINVNNPKGLLKPNLMALVDVNESTIKDVITLPFSVVQQDVMGEYYVYLVKEGEKGKMAQKTIIETSDNEDGNVIITSGVQEGDEVIMKGARIVNNSDLVDIVVEEPISE